MPLSTTEILGLLGELKALDADAGEKLCLAMDMEAEYFIAFQREHGHDMDATAAKNGFSHYELVQDVRRVFTDDDYHTKIFGYTLFEESLMMNCKLSLEQARYVSQHPCLSDAYDACSWYSEHKRCGGGCTEWNGFFYIKTGPGEPVRPNIPVQEKYFKKPVLNLDVEKAIKDGTLDDELNGFLNDVAEDKKQKAE